MCKDKGSDDNTKLGSLSFQDHEDDDVYFFKFFPKIILFLFIQIVDENYSTVTHKIQRPVLIAHIKSLAIGPTNEEFITPSMAFKIVDFIHLLNHRMAITSEVSRK